MSKDADIKRRFTVPHTSQQNGLAERKNRTLVETARCLLTQSGLPKSFWAEAIITANYIRNCCYTNTIGCTPYVKWTGRKPDVSPVRLFGEKVYALDKTPTKGKFDYCGLEGYFLGYADNSKAYRVWLVNARKIICSRDVKFSNKFGNSLIEEKPDASHDSNIVDLSTQTVHAPDHNPIAAAEPDDDLQSKMNADPHDEVPLHGSPNLQDEPKRAQQDQASNDASTKNELFNLAVPTVNPDAVKPV
uniref:Integrase catalytic domain-containing protein n=1 Tax=Trichogramma kaykai TaxID=54128 RepID=A0ABD2WE74_9HYME